MLDIIKSYFKREVYYIILTNDNLYIKNHKKVIDVSENEILIETPKGLLKITGSNMRLSKIIASDLSIKGSIESVNSYDNNKS